MTANREESILLSSSHRVRRYMRFHLYRFEGYCCRTTQLTSLRKKVTRVFLRSCATMYEPKRAPAAQHLHRRYANLFAFRASRVRLRALSHVLHAAGTLDPLSPGAASAVAACRARARVRPLDRPTDRPSVSEGISECAAACSNFDRSFLVESGALRPPPRSFS